MQRTFLQTLVGGKLEISAHECDVRQKNLNLTWMKPPYIVVEIAPNLCCVDITSKDNLLIEYEQAVKQAFKSQGIQGYCFCNYYNNIEAIILLNEINPRRLDEIFIKIHDRLYLNQGLDLFIGIGSSVSELRKVSESAADAHLMLSYKYQYADRGVINYNNLVKFQRNSNVSSSIVMDRVLGCFQDGDLGRMEIRLHELVEEVRNKSNVTTSSIRRALIEVTVRILNEASYAGIDVDAVLCGRDPYNWILSQTHTERITEWIMEISSTLLSQMESKINSKEKDVIVLAKSYIEDHLSDPGLNLTDVSENVGLSSTYFSQLFKKETGIGFNNYVVNLRIDRAKQLLGADLTQEEIAKQTGFQSASYFSRKFKKCVGLTPSSFKRTKP